MTVVVHAGSPLPRAPALSDVPTFPLREESPCEEGTRRIIANRRHEARALIYACMAYDLREKTRTAPSFDESAEPHRLIAAIGSGRLPPPDRFSGVAGEKQYEELYDT